MLRYHTGVRVCVGTHASMGVGGAIIYIGSVHSKEASLLKAPYIAAKHGTATRARAWSPMALVHVS